MDLNPHRQPVPEELVTPLFTIRRQQETDNAADYEAVMASKEALRTWSHSAWPEDDFTPEANLDDLRMHIAEHDRHEAYGYSVYAPDGRTLLGSLYLNAVAPFRDAYTLSEADEAVLNSADVRVEYWLRQGTPPATERAFVQAVQHWLTEAWWFSRVLFGSRRDAHAQRAVYEATGMTEQACLQSKVGDRRFHFHGVA